MRAKLLFLMMMLIAVISVYSQAPTAAELLRKVDSNEIFATIRYDGEMVIEHGRRHIVKTMKAWGRGNNDSFIEFTNREDIGTRYLKTNGEFWMTSQDIETEEQISGHLLRNWMGSDFSYEETIENETLVSRYDPVITGSDVLEGREAWVLELSARNPKTENYPKRKLWIDKENGDLLRYELFALSGTKLMEYTMRRVELIGGRRFPVESEMRDLLRRNSRTTFVMRNVVLDKPIADAVFTRRNLRNPVDN